MSFRKEIKFKISNSDLKFLRINLINAGMTVLYPKRKVCSCYFDTKDLTLFYQSEEGILPRKKVRYRWYGNDKKINQEIKISSVEGRFKILEKFYHNKQYLFKKHIFKDSQNGLLYPKILITYNREYFIIKNLRLTIDTEIQYLDIKKNFQIVLFDSDNVIEIKTNLEGAENKIEKFLQLRQSRFSKYCRGILRLNSLL